MSNIELLVLMVLFLTLAAGTRGRDQMGILQRQVTGLAYVALLLLATFGIAGVIELRPTSIAIWIAFGLYGVGQFGRDILVPWGRDRERKE